MLSMPAIIAATMLGDSCSVFSDSACFERWGHFKTYGVPGTIHDPLNRAAIADGTCRLLGDVGPKLDGFALWREPDRVAAVISALAAAPATDRPSYFVRSTREALILPCSRPARNFPANFTLAARASALQNWYHALCAPENDPSWNGVYDPAEEPQQMALTAGFACVVACDGNGRNLSAGAMANLSKNVAAARSSRDAFCKVLPWGHAGDFSKATSDAELARMAEPLLATPCNCVS